jgi:hypothetical protein
VTRRPARIIAVAADQLTAVALLDGKVPVIIKRNPDDPNGDPIEVARFDHVNDALDQHAAMERVRRTHKE